MKVLNCFKLCQVNDTNEEVCVVYKELQGVCVDDYTGIFYIDPLLDLLRVSDKSQLSYTDAGQGACTLNFLVQQSFGPTLTLFIRLSPQKTPIAASDRGKQAAVLARDHAERVYCAAYAM